MPGFFEKRQMRKRLYSAPVVALLVLLAGFLGMTAFDAYDTMRSAKERLGEEAAQLAGLEEREEALKEEVEDLKTDRGIEQEIREKFNVGREGEGVIVLVDQTASPEGDPGETRPSGGLFGRLLDWFAR